MLTSAFDPKVIAGGQEGSGAPSAPTAPAYLSREIVRPAPPVARFGDAQATKVGRNPNQMLGDLMVSRSATAH
jgi:hypothetical protein